jgi:serine phosphatase RsbU (regulator of sigma subunit)
VASAIVGIESPLKTAVAISAATHGDAAIFRTYLSAYVGPTKLFVSASLWRVDAAGGTALAAVGAKPALDPSSTAARTMRSMADGKPSFVVQSVAAGDHKSVAYAVGAHPLAGYVVLAERAIPANRRVAVESTSAFSDLHFATYLGKSTATANMQTTDVPIDQLPLHGDVVIETIPFGTTFLTLATSPSGHLGGALGAELPWILLLGGGILTLLTGVITGELVRRRTNAEADARTITGLYDTLDGLFAEQRTISETLQRALLPQRNPVIPDLEIAARYVAGARGVEVGGDWYSLIRLDEQSFAFVVGDVSGRGVEAAALMARIRFTLRAYLVEGHPPEVALGLCSREVNVLEDGHIATALVGVGDLATGTITVASAGHLNPLLTGGGTTRFIPTSVGFPLGVGVSSYEPVQATIEVGETLIAYTDGLVERRGESITVGLQRLADAVQPEGPLDEVLSRLLTSLNGDSSEDDIAILAFRRLRAASHQTPDELARATVAFGTNAVTGYA